MAGKTLYERLGNYNAISAVVDAMMRRMAGDARLSKYFIGHGENSKKRLRQFQVNMICEATGGPCFYTGRDIKTVHKGLGINGEDWQVLISHILSVLETFKVPEAEQTELMSLISNLKSDIVEKT
ncbi:MAG: group 1 truncated hemoglobin [Methanotrichaceae archaeon]|nr:group 1 truncated hemoglobin [Methanotrichaceae archaeon]